MKCTFSKDKNATICGQGTFLAIRVKVAGGYAIADVCHRHGHYKDMVEEVTVERKPKSDKKGAANAKRQNGSDLK